MKHPPKAATPSERRRVPRTHPALIVLQAADGLDAPIRALTVLLAQALAVGHGDAVLVIHLEDPAPADSRWSIIAGPPSLSPTTSIAGPLSRTPSIETDAGRVDRLRLPVADDPRRARDEIEERLRQLWLRYAYVFVDASGRGTAFARRLAVGLGAAELDGTVRRFVSLGPNGAAPPAYSEGWSGLHTYLLEPQPDREEPAPPAPGLRGKLASARKLAISLGERLGGAAIEPQGEPHPEARVDPEWCRVRLDLRAIAALPDPAFERLPAAARTSIARWARAVTWRRVGVALGGSGSWGYAHVALLQELEARGIPIDIVGGSSSGSLMGAYYAVLGRPGLDLAIRRGERFARLVWLSTISSTVIDAGIDVDFGHALLEDLEVVLLPVATNLSFARAEVITRSTVASAVRASTAAPGFFAATITRAGLYVDGAITDNVPVLLVERMGADLLVVCNPLPPPPNVRVRAPGTPIDDFLAEFNLLDRIRDLWVSFELMFHDYGDCEPAETRIVYEPPSQAHALFRTFAFAEAEALVAAVKREDSFRDAVQRSAEAWERLARARGPA